MHIEKIKLKNFRNYINLTVNFHKNWNILIGYNGAGKTNVLESIYYASTTKSPRTIKIENLLNYEKENFSIDIEINREENIEFLKHNYSKNLEKQKEIKLNSKVIKLSELIGKIPFVYFLPDDLYIIKGDGVLRRKLLDFVLFQIYPNYKFLSKKYNDLLIKRNFLLKEIKYNRSRIKYLDEWTQILIKSGLDIYFKRKELVEILNSRLNAEYNNIYFKDIKLEIKYSSFLDIKNEYDDDLEKKYLDTIQKSYEQEIKCGFTLIGPHRDDLEFFINNQNVKKYASQGQQRLYILTLKILIADIIKDFLKENPILIFDDVFSELDIKNIEKLVNVLSEKYQIFISAVDIDKIEHLFDKSMINIFKVDNGKIELIN